MGGIHLSPRSSATLTPNTSHCCLAAAACLRRLFATAAAAASLSSCCHRSLSDSAPLASNASLCIHSIFIHRQPADGLAGAVGGPKMVAGRCRLSARIATRVPPLALAAAACGTGLGPGSRAGSGGSFLGGAHEGGLRGVS